MKKLSLLFLAGMISLGLAAQTDAGNMYVGVNSGFGFESSTPEGGDATSSMAFDALGGYFVMDNLAIMAELGYSKYGDADANTAFGIGARYYINGIFPMLMYRVPAEDFSEIVLGAGYAHMLTDNIVLEPMLTYEMGSFDGEAAYKDLGIRIGFGLHF